jgi:hypothetical protein
LVDQALQQDDFSMQHDLIESINDTRSVRRQQDNADPKTSVVLVGRPPLRGEEDVQKGRQPQ